MKQIVTISILVFIHLFVFASESEEQKSSKLANLRENLSIIIKNAEINLENSANQSFLLSDSAFRIAKKYDDIISQAEAMIISGRALLELNKYHEAVEKLYKAEIIYKSIGDFLNISQIEIYAGRAYTQLGRYAVADEHFNYANNLLVYQADKNNNANTILQLTAILYNYRALLNKRLENYQIALDYHFKELKIYQQLNDSLRIGNTYADIGRIYKYLNNDNEAVNYSLLAYNIVKRFGRTKVLANTYKKLGLVYFELFNYNVSVSYLEKAVELYKFFDDIQGLAVCYNTLGKICCKNLLNKAGLDYFKLSLGLVKKSNDGENILLTYKYLSDAYHNLKMDDSAFIFINLRDAIKDSIYQIDKEVIIQETENKYKLQEQYHKIKQLQIENQNAFMSFALFGFFVSLIIIILIYNRYRIKFKNNIILQQKNTELEALYQEVLVSMQKADDLVKTKESILRNLSHELQTPFNIIFGFISLLKNELKSSDNPKAAEYLENINYQSNSLYNLLNDIYEISRIEQLGKNLVFTNFILNDIVNCIYRKYEKQIEQKNIYFEIFECGDITMTSEPNIIKRILEHLIDNAVKFTDDGGVKVVLSKRNTIENNIQINIEDSGTGIDDEYLSRVFELFSQEEMNITRSYEGNGLGLFITKKYLNILDGEIKIESTKGKGTKIIVYLNSEFECNSVK